MITYSLLFISISFGVYFLFGFNRHYLVLAITVPFACVCALLLLNTIVLYIYIKYFVSPQVKKKEVSFKPLRFTHKSIWPQMHKRRQLENEFNKASLDANDEINEAFNTLLKYVLRDFIQSWYIKITGTIHEQSFPIAVDAIIRSAAIEITHRLENIDLLYVILNKCLPRITSHISEFRTAEVSLRGKYLERSVTQSDELDLLLASRFRFGKLHKALTTVASSTQPTEIAYLRHLIDRVLPYLINHKELSSGPVNVVIREIVSNSVLQPILNMLADPDYWNQTIDTYVSYHSYLFLFLFTSLVGESYY